MRRITPRMPEGLNIWIELTVSHSVVNTLRLTKKEGQEEGTLFPMPIILDVSQEDINKLNLKEGGRVALRDPRDEAALAIITSTFRLHAAIHADPFSLRHLYTR
jgi:ATP sulfurylase